ncbi:TRAF3-interacting JNK-activating modulator [Stigmatopora argus]
MEVRIPRGFQASPTARKDFDRKVELRAEKHEQLRRRTNMTSCRSHARDCDTALLKRALGDKRQEEFRKKRSLPPFPRLPSEGGSFRLLRVSACPSASFPPPCSNSTDGRHNVKMKMMAEEEVIESENDTHETDAVNFDAHTPAQKMSEVGVQTESGLLTVDESDIVQLQDYMQEGLWREEAITKKVAALQDCFLQLHKALSTLWKSRCSEDTLRSQIKVLETQLQVSLQKLPKEESGKLGMQMKTQKTAFEDKSEMITQQKTEELTKNVALKEALITAKTDVLRLQSLYEELKLTSQNLGQELDASRGRARERDTQLELSKAREAALSQELTSLRRENNKLRCKMSLMDEYQQKEINMLLGHGDVEKDAVVARRDASVQSAPEEENAMVRGDCNEREEIGHIGEELRLKEKECETLKTELHAMEQALQSSQTQLSQYNDELGSLAGHPRKSTWDVVTRWSFRVFFLFLTFVGVGVMATWRPPHLLFFGEKLEEFYLDIGRRMENFWMQMASSQHSLCFRPI